MPPIGTCGLGVDFLRECYHSERKLFRAYPEVITRGFYWFLEKGAAMVPQEHVFGSANWMRHEIEESPEIGEQLEPRHHVTGDPPAPRPQPHLCGSLAEIAGGSNDNCNGQPLQSVTLPPCPNPISYYFSVTVKKAQGFAMKPFIRMRGAYDGSAFLASFFNPMTGDTIDFEVVHGLTVFVCNVYRNGSFIGFIDQLGGATCPPWQFDAQVGWLVLWEPIAIPPCYVVQPNKNCCGQETALVHLEDYDLNDRATLFALCHLLETSYDVNGINALAELTALADAPDVFAFVANPSGLVPGSFIGIYPNYALVFISGTTDADQVGVQAMQFLAGPVDQGFYSASPLYQAAALTVHNRCVLAGLDPSLPVMLVGHSYGGATAIVLGAIYKLAQPGRQVQVLTFGAPKPGDQRLADIADAHRMIQVQGIGDPIVATPPSSWWLPVVEPLAGAGLAGRWILFRRGTHRVVVGNQGIQEFEGEIGDFQQMVALVRAALGLTGVPSFVPHGIAVYSDRLSD